MNSNTIGSSSRKQKTIFNKNPLETMKDLSVSAVKNTAHQVKKMGSGMFDQFFGNYDSEYKPGMEKSKSVSGQRKEFSIFNYQNYYEKEIVKREIRQLSELIKKEIDLIKKADSALLQEVKDIQKLTLESLPEITGIYHIRFFELVLSILRTLRAKIGESRTWMQAMISKRKKRGSLFASLSKKKGTMYSLSQELQSSRSVQ